MYELFFVFLRVWAYGLFFMSYKKNQKNYSSTRLIQISLVEVYRVIKKKMT